MVTPLKTGAPVHTTEQAQRRSKLKAKSTRAPSLLGFFIHNLAAHPGGSDCPAARSEAYALALKQHAMAVGRAGHDSSSDDEMTEAMDGVTPKQEAEGAEAVQRELPLLPPISPLPPAQAHSVNGTAAIADGAYAEATAPGDSNGAGEASATMDTGLDHAWAQAEDAGDAQGWLALVYDALRDGEEEAEDAGQAGPNSSGCALTVDVAVTPVGQTLNPTSTLQYAHAPHGGPVSTGQSPPPLPGHSQGQQGWASPPALNAEWEPTGERRGWSAPPPDVGLAAEGMELGRGFAAHAEEWLARSDRVPVPAADLPDSPSVPAPAFAPGSWRAGSSQPPSQPAADRTHRLAQRAAAGLWSSSNLWERPAERAAAGHSWGPSAFPSHLPGSSAPQQQQPLASSGRHAHPPTAPQPCASAYAPPPHAASTAYFGDGYYGGWLDDGTSSAPELHTPRRATDGGMYAPPSGPMQSPQPPFYPPPCPSCCCACGAGRWHQKPANAYGMQSSPYDPRAANGRWVPPPPPSHQGWSAPSGHGPLSTAPSAPSAFGVPSWDPCATDGWPTVEGAGGPATPGQNRFGGRCALPRSRNNLERGSLPSSWSLASVASAYPEQTPSPMSLWTAAAPGAGDLAPAAASARTPRSSAAVADPPVARCMPYTRQSDPGVHRRIPAPKATGLAPQPPCAAVGPRRLPSDLQALFDRTGMPPPPDGPLPPFLHELNGKPEC
ncbi:hypothetical protein HYH03_012012 [Edaphochlamys debaryana]|uniref:Uncharacterized protein n=1 Tax=Edaphochlamys debaryana TaxID=47281 RepID=A0A835XWC2_9CHLO|nr:hypothetical protein HYH03_012012 [Edaphochlamys debaryana]|eukprot:KAG2489561.1 hypothetical protein HYH03_012012 [Edaphochlamys debaryana]